MELKIHAKPKWNGDFACIFVGKEMWRHAERVGGVEFACIYGNKNVANTRGMGVRHVIRV